MRIRPVIALLVALPLCALSLSGCSPAAIDRPALAATAAPRVDRTRVPVAVPTPPSSVGVGAGGAGSVTVALTQPVALSGHAGTTVTCTSGRSYQASAIPVPIGGSTLGFTVDVRGYTGPGAYTAVVTLALAGSAPQSIPVPAVPVTITDAGGSVDLSAAGEKATVAGSLAWACG